MVVDTLVSAVVVRIPVPPAIQRIRVHWDDDARSGVPSHVTILYPFMPPGRLEPAVRHELARIATEHGPFHVSFDRVERFPGVVYLAPDPAEPFIQLTEAIATAFPAFPPYGGAFDEVIPHLTVVDSETAPLDELARHAEGALPFSIQVSHLEVLEDSGVGRWRRHWRIPLGAPRP